MTIKFLLHKEIKEIKEIAKAQMAHLVLPDTQADPSANPKEPLFNQLLDNKSILP